MPNWRGRSTSARICRPLMAKAELARRAAEQARFNGRCMLGAVIIAALAAIASRVERSGRNPVPYGKLTAERSN